MISLRLAYLGLALGLLGFGGALLWLGLRRPTRPVETPLRVLMGLAVALAAAGTTAAVILEGRVASPW